MKAWKCESTDYQGCYEITPAPQGWKEDEAAVALIAAAPDLLAALEYLLPIAAKNVETSFGKDAIRIARAAIAKAKGEQA